MGIFSDIVSKISDFAHNIVGDAQAAPSSDASQAASSSENGASKPATLSSIDVENVLKNLAANAGQSLNYQTSIVDLLKLLGLDSSLDARRKLADELHFPGDREDSASMNIWLIKQVYTELAQNGGSLPSGWGH